MKTDKLVRLVKTRIRELGMGDPVKIMEHIDNEESLSDSEKEECLTIAETQISLAQQRLNLQEKTIPMYVVEDFIDNNPIHYDRSKIWWVWNESKQKYEMCDDTDICNMIYDDNDDTRILSSAVRSQYLHAFQIVGRKKKLEEVPVNHIQFKDCVIDIDLEELQPFQADSDYFYTNPIPHNVLDTKNECPIIDKMFEDWVGAEQKELLYEICAYCMLNDYPIHRIFCFIGAGRNGKSSFMNFLKKFIGIENCTSVRLDQLDDSRFEVANLYQKKVCFIAETNFKLLENTSTLKRASGGDMLTAEFKQKSSFNFVNFAKIIIATNTLPITTDRTEGFYRRWTIIDFKNQFKDNGDIIADIPQEEYDAFARICIIKLKNLMTNKKFTNDKSIEERQKEYEAHSNPIIKFIEESLDKSVDDYVWFWEFRDKFETFCKERGFRTLSTKELSNALDNEGLETKLKDHWIGNDRKQWKGILGYKWRQNPVTDVTDVTDSPLNSYIQGTKSEVDNIGHIDNITPSYSPSVYECDQCRQECSQLFKIPDKYAPEITMNVCEKCLHKEKL